MRSVMNKTNRKLTLGKETLKTLAGEALRAAIGGLEAAARSADTLCRRCSPSDIYSEKSCPAKSCAPCDPPETQPR